MVAEKSIKISEQLKQKLDELKIHPNQSYNEVIDNNLKGERKGRKTPESSHS